MISLINVVLFPQDEGRHVLDSLGRFADRVRVWRRRSRARRQLAQLDRRMLRDLGIDPVAVQYEIAQPFWVGEQPLRD